MGFAPGASLAGATGRPIAAASALVIASFRRGRQPKCSPCPFRQDRPAWPQQPLVWRQAFPRPASEQAWASRRPGPREQHRHPWPLWQLQGYPPLKALLHQLQQAQPQQTSQPALAWKFQRLGQLDRRQAQPPLVRHWGRPRQHQRHSLYARPRESRPRSFFSFQSLPKPVVQLGANALTEEPEPQA